MMKAFRQQMGADIVRAVATPGSAINDVTDHRKTLGRANNLEPAPTLSNFWVQLAR